MFIKHLYFLYLGTALFCFCESLIGQGPVTKRLSPGWPAQKSGHLMRAQSPLQEILAAQSEADEDGTIFLHPREHLIRPLWVPNWNSAPQAEIPTRAGRPLTQKDQGCVSVCCLHCALGVVFCQELSVCLLQSCGTHGHKPHWTLDPGN